MPLRDWPVFRQLVDRDVQGLGASARSRRTEGLTARTEQADDVVRSVCPYCAVGCGQLVHVADGAITNIEGDPDSPISRGRLCPKGAATFQLVTGSYRQRQVLYRRPNGTSWEPMPLEQAMDMVAERVKRARDEHWEDSNEDGKPLRRTMAFAHLGGATLDNEENYLMKKLLTAVGVVQEIGRAHV